MAQAAPPVAPSRAPVGNGRANRAETMEWIETTGRSVAEALDAALDELGVDEQDAEVVIIEEPRSGLFGLGRSEARIRARVRPSSPRPKRSQRDRSRASRGGRPGPESGAHERQRGGVSVPPTSGSERIARVQPAGGRSGADENGEQPGTADADLAQAAPRRSRRRLFKRRDLWQSSPNTFFVKKPVNGENAERQFDVYGGFSPRFLLVEGMLHVAVPVQYFLYGSAMGGQGFQRAGAPAALGTANALSFRRTGLSS